MADPDLVEIESLGNRVGGIARPEGSPAVFVRGALPGEQVRIKITGGKKSFLEADILSVVNPSPYRIEPFCSLFGRCGGCSLQHLEYGRELHWKKEWVKKAVRNLDTPDVSPVVPSPETIHYRNRVTFDVTDGKLTLHAFRGDPIEVETCPLMNRNAQEALKEMKNDDHLKGVQRVSVRGSLNTPDRCFELFSNGNWHRHRSSMTEKLGGLLFPISPGGFFQVNTAAAEILSATVLEMIKGFSGRVLDLYGGTGTFGIPLSLLGYTVDSVEMNRNASEGCRRAAELNNVPLDRIRALNLRDRVFLSSALKEKTRYSIIVTDPPRAGMGIRSARQIRRLDPSLIVYVSCNPFSAARDIAILREGGYRIKKIVPVDMFPRTDHVETVFLLEGNSK